MAVQERWPLWGGRGVNMTLALEDATFLSLKMLIVASKYVTLSKYTLIQQKPNSGMDQFSSPLQ